MRGSSCNSAIFFLVIPVVLAFFSARLSAEEKKEEAENLKQALAQGKASIVLRYRYEFVEEDALPGKDAHASTLRTTLAYETLPFKGINFFMEAENVTVVGNDQLYRNAGAGDRNNGVTDRPVVADPALTEMNQAFLRLRIPDTVFLLGRQELIHVDQRFVGNVGWRQNHQSFDALTVSNQTVPRTTLSYSFLDRVNRIFGDHQQITGHLAFGKLNAGRVGEVHAYGYLLNYAHPHARLSTRTLGGELLGSQEVGPGLKLLYEVELATQRDFSGNPVRIRADYSHFMGGVDFGGITVKLARELLSGSRSAGQFNTPLGTNHQFNGWADLFLTTPPDGLRDVYVSVEGRVAGVSWLARYDDFDADSVELAYGSELDLQALYTASWDQLFAVTAAFYRAAGFSTDTTKVWIWTQYRF